MKSKVRILVLVLFLSLFYVQQLVHVRAPFTTMEIAKDDGDVGCVNPGDTITYTITYENDLGSIQHNVIITDNLPPETLFNSASGSGTYDGPTRTVTWNIGTLLVGGSGSVTLEVSVKAGTAPGTTITNTATIFSDESSENTVFENTAVCRPPTVESCDGAGNVENKFSLTEDVYVKGCGYAPSTTYNIYVVEDVSWDDGKPIPPRVSGSVTTVTTASGGCISPSATLVWGSPVVGKYDIVVDVLENGKYDEGIDALDDRDIEVTAGFFIIPELSFGTILGLAACLTALGLYKSKRMHA